jgi:hypothetical protein
MMQSARFLSLREQTLMFGAVKREERFAFGGEKIRHFRVFARRERTKLVHVTCKVNSFGTEERVDPKSTGDRALIMTLPFIAQITTFFVLSFHLRTLLDLRPKEGDLLNCLESLT